MDYGVPTAVILDHGREGVPVCKAIGMHVDDVVLCRRAADSQIALVEIKDDVVSGAEIELEGVIVRSSSYGDGGDDGPADRGAWPPVRWRGLAVGPL
jgi:hypothetical protein